METEYDKLIYILSHDLREPSTTIEGLVSLLKEEYEAGNREKVEQYIHYIDLSSKKLSRRISGLLFYSKIGKEEVEEVIDLKKLIEKTWCHFLAQGELTCDHLSNVQVFPQEFTQAIEGILSNALIYSDSEKELKLVVSQKRIEGGIEISFKDNGIGLNSGDDEPFELFKKMHPKKNLEGAGLGLSIVKKTIKRIGGDVSYASKENNGFTITIKIPSERVYDN